MTGNCQPVAFLLGTHMPSWLGRTNVPLFVSHRRLAARRTLPSAKGVWALDSGGFSELSLFGEWRTTPAAYVVAVRRYIDEIGQLAWAAPQDWMCEPWVIAKTGLGVAEHQRRTIENYLRLRELAPEAPWVPVIQGWTRDDYMGHLDGYAAAGVDLARCQLVGLGSVCRRQATGEIGAIVREIAGQGVRLHGFGVKLLGLRQFGARLASADSMAWSMDARRAGSCQESGGSRINCANCLHYAMAWRERALQAAGW